MLELNSYYIHQFKLTIICGTITVSLMESVARKEDGSPKLSVNAQHSSTANSVPHRQRPESRAASSPEAMPLHFLPLLKFTCSFTLFSRGFWTAESQHPALCDLGSGKTGMRQAPPGEPTAWAPHGKAATTANGSHQSHLGSAWFLAWLPLCYIFAPGSSPAWFVVRNIRGFSSSLLCTWKEMALAGCFQGSWAQPSPWEVAGGARRWGEEGIPSPLSALGNISCSDFSSHYTGPPGLQFCAPVSSDTRLLSPSTRVATMAAV